MSPDAVVAVCLALTVLFVMLAVRAPVAIALGVAGTVGLIMLRGWQVSGSTPATAPFQTTGRYGLVGTPLCVAMGTFAEKGGLAGEVYRVRDRLLGRLPGGLALASVGACAGFAAVSGSSNA